MSNGDWFAPKRFGYGAGLPIAWQGWALLVGYMAVAIALTALLPPHHSVLLVGLLIVLTIPLLIVSAQHTKGGWRWRWGGE